MMNCKKCGKEILTGQEVRLPDINGVFCRACHEAAAVALIRDVFAEKGSAAELRDEEDEPEDEGYPPRDPEDLMGELESSAPYGWMSCCGAARRSDRDEGDPCYNCGAI